MGRVCKYLPFLFNVGMSLWAIDALVRALNMPQPLEQHEQWAQATGIIVSFATFALAWVLIAYGLRLLAKRYADPTDDKDAFS